MKVLCVVWCGVQRGVLATGKRAEGVSGARERCDIAPHPGTPPRLLFLPLQQNG